MSVTVPEEWLADLERRHLAELSFPEVRKGLQALSSLYVERRGRIGTGAAFDGAGKRAAFALFFGPLHFLVVREIVDALGAAAPPLSRVLDLGCGTGPAGAAWALAAGGSPEVSGIERSGWAAQEARETFRALGLRGRAAAGELLRERLPGSGAGIVLGWTVNELPDAGPRGAPSAPPRGRPPRRACPRRGADRLAPGALVDGVGERVHGRPVGGTTSGASRRRSRPSSLSSTRRRASTTGS